MRSRWDDVPESVRASMRSNKSKGTRPEVAVRSLLWSLGYRYQLHRRDLPGKPDIVFPVKRKAVFVHGCFWHQHEGCRKAHIPHSRIEYWMPKLARNRARDIAVLSAMENIGWLALVVWECEIENREALTNKLRAFLQ
ncbi:very short patch repair endonuclease [Beijerinckia indica]|uniref:Very short patch repair endonuclease n=1 Tax=Beijerinckia indica subsp. indica (strain ATCC 9039 / DSM 1715 / NCIMB 8712) TaxID=395963 RepID=B2IGZ7_BEII9|nr:very short patch repair endonuclease [Beijerinckia indica]ACB94411.1 DNA mismatch endonuclease Vsr [Beijerinckia indica subsp. indica ATCC 9039]